MQTAVKSRMRGWYRTMASMVKVSAPPGPRQTGHVLAPDSCPIFHLEGFSNVPVLSFYLDLLRRHQGFAFVKRTHGFWDGLVYLCDVVPEIEARVTRGETIEARFIRELFNDDAVVKAVEQRSGFTSHFHDHFYSELVEDLQAAFGDAVVHRGDVISRLPKLRREARAPAR